MGMNNNQQPKEGKSPVSSNPDNSSNPSSNSKSSSSSLTTIHVPRTVAEWKQDWDKVQPDPQWKYQVQKRTITMDGEAKSILASSPLDNAWYAIYGAVINRRQPKYFLPPPDHPSFQTFKQLFPRVNSSHSPVLEEKPPPSFQSEPNSIDSALVELFEAEGLRIIVGKQIEPLGAPEKFKCTASNEQKINWKKNNNMMSIILLEQQSAPISKKYQYVFCSYISTK